MTEAQKKVIKDNAWSLPPDKEPPGKILFSEKVGNETFYYYESETEGEYVYDTESYRTHRMIMRDQERRKAAERRRRLLA